jgi:hypothetical protein
MSVEALAYVTKLNNNNILPYINPPAHHPFLLNLLYTPPLPSIASTPNPCRSLGYRNFIARWLLIHGNSLRTCYKQECSNKRQTHVTHLRFSESFKSKLDELHATQPVQTSRDPTRCHPERRLCLRYFRHSILPQAELCL